METEYTTTLIRLLLAFFAGGLIGFERTYHGRPAGFRTHAIVCAASSLLMLLAIFQWKLIEGAPIDTVRVDPTRMAQGIMTGIGFLGAGVIMKEALTVRGLTTAASIWMTASIGVVIGMGLYFAAIAATFFSLCVLVIFRRLEKFITSFSYSRLKVRFARHEYMQVDELQEFINSHDIKCTRISYKLTNEGKLFQYQMTISTNNSNNYRDLSNSFSKLEKVIEFSIIPTGD